MIRQGMCRRPYIAEKIAEIKGVPVQKVYDQTYANALKMYKM